MKKIAFHVTFDLPPQATEEDALAYMYDAVGTMVGCYRPPGAEDEDDPGDPMWPLNVDSITIQIVK